MKDEYPNLPCFSDHQIIEGIQTNNYRILEIVYQKYYPIIRFHIQKNRGTETDAKDVLQDGLVIIYQKLIQNRLHLKCSFETFLFSVCKKLWLKHLERRKRFPLDSWELCEEIEFQNDILTEIEASERYRLYRDSFNDMKEPCKTILLLFFDKTPMAEIAYKMGFSDYYIKKKKHYCMKHLIESIKSNEKYHELCNN